MFLSVWVQSHQVTASLPTQNVTDRLQETIPAFILHVVFSSTQPPRQTDSLSHTSQ